MAESKLVITVAPQKDIWPRISQKCGFYNEGYTNFSIKMKV